MSGELGEKAFWNKLYIFGINNLYFMSLQGTVRRYSLIIEKIGNKHFPSFNNIKHYLYDHGFEISDRTLQRDIEQIRVEFGIELSYNRTKNGYWVDENKSVNTSSFLRFLEIVTTAELFMDSLRDSKQTLNYISFDAHGNLKGIDNLKNLLFALKNHRTISFDHESFQTGKIHCYSIRPYLIKEYLNRWYVIGTVDDSSNLLTFGIDRINSLEVKAKIFVPDDKIRPLDLFTYVVGLTYSSKDPQEVILSFTPLQGKYVKSLPWHESQEVLIDNEEEMRVSLFIIPNFEFRQKILKMGDRVKVIKPVELTIKIRKILQKALDRYN